MYSTLLEFVVLISRVCYSGKRPSHLFKPNKVEALDVFRENVILTLYLCVCIYVCTNVVYLLNFIALMC